MSKPCKLPSLGSWAVARTGVGQGQLPEGNRSCSSPSRWSCAPSRKCRDVSSSTWYRKPGTGASKQDPCFTSVEEDGGDKRLVQLELACEVDGFAPPDPV